MALQNINIGTTANDGTGDNLRQAFKKTESNFSELYSITNGGPFPSYTGFVGQCRSDTDTGWRYIPWLGREYSSFPARAFTATAINAFVAMFTNGTLTNLGIRITNDTDAEIGIYIDNTNPQSNFSNAASITWDFTQTLTSSGPNSGHIVSPNLTVNTLDSVRVGVRSTTATAVGVCYYTMQLTHS